MAEIIRATFDDKTVDALIRLSKLWAEEGITNGLVPNTKEDLREPCFLAVEGEEIVGYAFGHFQELEKHFSFAPVGAKIFELDEIYVLPAWRSKGIGHALMAVIKEEAKKNADFLTLPTSTKDYKSILHFYIEQEGLSFHSAFLFEPLKG